MAKSKTSLVVPHEHICEALTLYLRSMSLINDNEYVYSFSDHLKTGCEVYLEKHHEVV